MSIRSRYGRDPLTAFDGFGVSDATRAGRLVSRVAPVPHGSDLARDLLDTSGELRSQLEALSRFGGPMIAMPLQDKVEELRMVIAVAAERAEQYDTLFKEYDESLQHLNALEAQVNEASSAADDRIELARRLVEAARHNQRLVRLIEHLRDVLREESRAGRMARQAPSRVFREAEARETADFSVQDADQ